MCVDWRCRGFPDNGHVDLKGEMLMVGKFRSSLGGYEHTVSIWEKYSL